MNERRLDDVEVVLLRGRGQVVLDYERAGAIHRVAVLVAATPRTWRRGRS